VAADGLQVVPVSIQTATADTANNNSLKQPSGSGSAQGYCDISVPVYATVKGVRSCTSLQERMCFIQGYVIHSGYVII
jgi:hypothetical protein